MTGGVAEGLHPVGVGVEHLHREQVLSDQLPNIVPVWGRGEGQHNNLVPQGLQQKVACKTETSSNLLEP